MLDAELVSYYFHLYGTDTASPPRKGNRMKHERDNSDRYSRLCELLDLINLLRSRRLGGAAYDEIQKRFGWTRRTAERMLKIIEGHYHSFRKERNIHDNKVYFRLLTDSSLPPSDITENEIVALKTALGLVDNNDQLKFPLESLAGKLEATKCGGARNIEYMTLANGTASAPRPRIRCDNKIVEALQEAILACCMVKIKYKRSGYETAVSLTVCPLGFLYGMQNNYLVACYVDKNEEPRHYILSQIQSVRPTAVYFEAEEFDIHEYAKKSFGAWIAHDGGYRVKWKVKPQAAERAKQFEFHPTQKITEMKDGSLTVEFYADGLKEMAWHLMTWEGMIKPVAPKELVEEYERQLKLAAGALR
jgi:predicted DNA-binding transcriptional regulator YafY